MMENYDCLYIKFHCICIITIKNSSKKIIIGNAFIYVGILNLAQLYLYSFVLALEL